MSTSAAKPRPRLLRLADGSESGRRTAASYAHAVESAQSITRLANRVSQEMDEVTQVNGIPTTDLDPEDSAVIVVEEALRKHRA